MAIAHAPSTLSLRERAILAHQRQEREAAARDHAEAQKRRRDLFNDANREAQNVGILTGESREWTITGSDDDFIRSRYSETYADATIEGERFRVHSGYRGATLHHINVCAECGRDLISPALDSLIALGRWLASVSECTHADEPPL